MSVKPSIGPLSTSPEVEGWLQNFEEEDRHTGSLLLDSLRIASEDEIRSALAYRLHQLIAELPGPILLLPARDIADIDPNWKSSLPKVYKDFLPSADMGSAPGSEAVIANILRDFYSRTKVGNEILTPEVTLEKLRERRCRTLLFVGDYAGSGSQVSNYMRSWLRNSTIRSWRSFGWIKIHFQLFAASSYAAHRLRGRGSVVDELYIIETANDFGSASWTERDERRIRNLCIRYASPKYRKRELGFGGHGGLFLMTHTVPNNLPAIMLQNQGPQNEDWVPLFPRRTFPPLLQKTMTGYRPRQEFDLDLDALTDQRLASAFNLGLAGIQRPFLTMLAIIAGSRHNEEAIAAELATSTININEMAKQLRVWGLIDDRNHLTDAGWEALMRARRRPRKITFRLKENTLPYYPLQLRGVGDT